MRVAPQDSLVPEMEVETSDTLYKSMPEGIEDREDRELEPPNESGQPKLDLGPAIQTHDAHKGKDSVTQSSGTASKGNFTAKKPHSQEENQECSCKDTQPVRGSVNLLHGNGDLFKFPLAHCKTSNGIMEMIKASYGSNERAKKDIQDGNFEIFSHVYIDGYRHAKFLQPQDWTSAISDRETLIVRLASEDDDKPLALTGTEDNSKTGMQDIKYEERVKYKIDYWLGTKHGIDKPELLTTTFHDHPVELITSSVESMKEQHVLEEIKSVTFKYRQNPPTKEQITGTGMKLDINDTIGGKKLKICSPFLLNALRAVTKYSFNAPSGDDTDTFKDGMFPYPFQDLFNHMRELQEYKKKTSKPRANHTDAYNEQTDRHIDLLMEYLYNENNINLKSLEASWEKKVPTTTFSGLLLLLKPGADVYVQEYDQLNAYVIDSVSGGVDYSVPDNWSWKLSPTIYSIYVWNLMYDGKTIKRRSKTIEIPVFDGDREIRSLPLFPTKFQDKFDDSARRKQLVDRGIKYFQYSKGPAFLEYSGLGLRPSWKKYHRVRVVVEHRSLPWNNPEFRNLSDSNLRTRSGVLHYFIDKNSKYTLGERARIPQCECNKCGEANSAEEVYLKPTFRDYDNIDPETVTELSYHQYMLCASHMFGFILKDRMHDLLDIAGLSKPKLVTNAIDSLVLRPERNKDTIKAIVQTYSDSTNQAELFSADFIQGKGEGQIFLLHGPPGTGKTLTAESVAEYVKSPLLSITAADLGHEPAVLEKNLLRFFRNATSWDAIVLLDEADVYLERRSSNDLRRNNVVSIFLRALDYFQGILFLTTNRVGHFDEAFMSRIHVSIGYDTLDDSARVQIWDALFRKLKDDHKNGGPEIHYDYDAKRYVQKHEDIKKLQWNGREIRNAFQTAVALAIFDSKKAGEKGSSKEKSIPEVTEAHLAQVVSMSTAFKKYIKATHEGYEDADLAYKLGNRYDGLNEEAAD